MYTAQHLKKNLLIKRLMVILALSTTMPSDVLCIDESPLSESDQEQKIDIFRKEILRSDLKTVDLSPSKQGKRAICHLSNKKRKTVWIDEKVLDKIEESTILEALQKGFKDEGLRCEFKITELKSGKFDGIVASPQEGQIVFYDVTSQK